MQLSAEYNASKSYAFMEALRNHVQHAGLPISSISFSSSRDDNNHFEFYTEAKASKASLLENPKFKKEALSEMPEDIDLVEVMREYIEALSRVQGLTRTSTKEVFRAREEVSAAIAEYATLYSNEPIGLGAICENDGVWIKQFPLLLKWDDIRQKLEDRNQSIASLSRRYVSNRIQKKS